VILGVAPALPFIKAGRVRPLAVLSEKRVKQLPDVPTGEEAGVPGFKISIWYGLFAPAGTPREAVSRLHAEVTKALQDTELLQRMSNAGMDPWLGTPEDLDRHLRSEIQRFSRVVKTAGIKAQ
jgi:tripartite-type tricarboxylate transporter receptor subunit TctC